MVTHLRDSTSMVVSKTKWSPRTHFENKVDMLFETYKPIEMIYEDKNRFNSEYLLWYKLRRDMRELLRGGKIEYELEQNKQTQA